MPGMQKNNSNKIKDKSNLRKSNNNSKKPNMPHIPTSLTKTHNQRRDIHNKSTSTEKLPKGALVIGGGISGIQAALDLAEAGVYTYLVERTPSIGGRMAQLDKTFPTNDCAMCILSPKLVTAARHPNIRLLTNSEVTAVSGSAGNYKVKVTKYPRFINEDKCVGCGECASKCPTKVPNEFDMGLGMRKAIYIPFPQAVPLVYSIDSENCRYLQNGKCGVCAKVCKAEAVEFDQEPEQLKLKIGAIIVATGFEQFDPASLEEFGYGYYKNVITGLEFERLLNASGPTQGKIIRPSDGKQPKRILFVQCVGSRDKHRAQEYCSRICCMYAIKEAMIAKEHQSDLEKITIVGMEIRAFGKGFEEYYNRSCSEGISFVKGRVAEIHEDTKTGELKVRVEDVEIDEVQEIFTDFVVLSSAVIPHRTNQQLSEMLGIDLDEHGFFKENELTVLASESTQEGIFLAGCAQGPKDIPDSVAQGSASAALAEKYLTDCHVDDKVEQTTKITRPEIISYEHEPRVGVFVCHCGINIGGILDVPELVRYAKTLTDVVFATDNLYTCSDDAQGLIQDKIKEHNLTRVVVASCTPRTHEPIFKDTCSRAGLNPYLFEMTNIRDQCSWVHMNEPEKGTEKAKDLIRMAVARARELSPLESILTPMHQSVLVVGGGISGMQCAIDLANQGVKTTLVESQTALGGRLNKLDKLAHLEITAEKFLSEKIKELKKSGVKTYVGYQLVDIQGYVGKFEITIEQTEMETKVNKKIRVSPRTGKLVKKVHPKQQKFRTGAIVLAIGADLYHPERENVFGYNKYSNVITNLELEEKMKDGSLASSVKDVVFIQCVGAREVDKEDGNTGCSRYCCQTALHQAWRLSRNGVNVTILHRGIRAFSKYAEELYFDASREGVRFVQFPDNNPPKVTKNGSNISVFDLALGRELSVPADLTVLTLAMVPNQSATDQLQKWLKVPRGEDGYFLELHPKLGPVETNTVGIYLCGCSQGPKDVTDSLIQASGAAAKVAALVKNDYLSAEPITAFVDQKICWGCGTCEELCVFGAASIIEVETSFSGFNDNSASKSAKVSEVNTALCKGCGVCASNCPSGAMSIKHFTNNQILKMINAFGEVDG